jgi:long-chain acyl-CoA synthetase
MLSHRNMVCNVFQSRAWQADIYADVERIIAITALPLYHSFSLQSNCLSVMYQGGENILITNPRDMPAFIKELKRHKFTYIPGVNTMFAALLNTPGFAELDFSGLRVTIGGGMAVQEAVARQWQEVTGNHITQAYGLTETSPAATSNPLYLKHFTGSIGLPISSTEAQIFDDDGKEMAQGEVGEICIRGPQVMEGYWQNPEETAKVMLPGGWFRTGDIGRMDENGFFYIEDRKNDMILVSGFNVYPNEIEGIVVEMDGILEAVRNDPSVTEEDVEAFCREKLTGYKIPKEIEFRDDLPKTNVGKILRRALREE